MKILNSTPLKYNPYQSKNNKQMQHAQSFGANTSKIGEFVTDGMAHGFGWLASTKPVQAIVNYLKDTNYQRHISAFVGVVLSSYYMIDTARSKKIEKDQKMPLILNQATVSVLSTAGAYLLDGWLDKKLAKTVDTIHIANISDENYRNAMIEYHSNKDSYEVMDKTSKLLRTKAKTEKQTIAKSLHEAFDTPENFEKLKNNLKDNKHAQELFQEIEQSQNPKEMLINFYERTDLFGEVLKEKFQLKNKDIKSLKALVQKGQADDTVKTLVESLEAITKDQPDRIAKSRELVLNAIEKSPILKKMYAKASFQNSIDLLAASDKNLKTRMSGFRFAKSIMVFAMIYRFVSPVIATPIANSISSEIEKRNNAKKGLQTAA